MATLDIFATNIIGTTKSVTNFSGLNAERWLTITSPSGSGHSGNFFIVKKLSQADSQSVSSAIDSTVGTNSRLTFDDNGNIQIPVEVRNPLALTTSLPSNKHKKQFLDKNIDGFSQSKDIIFSSNLKWILYRDRNDVNQMYILYNPMHNKNVKDYYNSVKSIGETGDNDMNYLIEKYSKIFTISPLDNANSKMAVFAEPTCACYDIFNCTNDFANFYVFPDTVRQLGYQCACSSGGSRACYYPGIDENLSFLKDFPEKAFDPSKCPRTINICNINLRAGNNIIAKDTNIQQNCGNEGSGISNINTQSPINTPPIISPINTPPIISPINTPGITPTNTPSKLSLSSPLVIIGGSITIIVIIAIIIISIVINNKKVIER